MNERFWKKRSLASNGIEYFTQAEVGGFVSCPLGHVTVGLVNTARKFAVCDSVANPAGSKFDVVTEPTPHAAGGGTIVGSQPLGG